jgi:hypothetical protein
MYPALPRSTACAANDPSLLRQFKRSVFQMCRVLSTPPLTRVQPSAIAQSDSTELVWPRNTRTQRQVAVHHTRMCRSTLPLHSLPGHKKHSDSTESVCPRNVCRHSVSSLSLPPHKQRPKVRRVTCLRRTDCLGSVPNLNIAVAKPYGDDRAHVIRGLKKKWVCTQVTNQTNMYLKG